MKAIQITEFGGPDVMHLVDLEDPKAADGFELIDVSAIGINYADTHQTENSYLSPQKLPLVPGIEVVGTTSKGVRVLAPVDGGGYAQKAITHSATMIPIPDGVSDGQALCMLVQGSTAWHILKTVGHVQPGETVVVHAAAGGVGTIAIQLAKLWGAKVIAVASSEGKRALATSLGADAVVEATHEKLGDAIRAANGGKRGNGGSITVAGAKISVPGKIAANGQKGGRITVTSAGDLSVAGKVSAKGHAGAGGRINLADKDVHLTGAKVNASGATGGGITATSAGALSLEIGRAHV